MSLECKNINGTTNTKQENHRFVLEKIHSAILFLLSKTVQCHGSQKMYGFLKEYCLEMLRDMSLHFYTITIQKELMIFRLLKCLKKKTLCYKEVFCCITFQTALSTVGHLIPKQKQYGVKHQH